MKNIQQKIGIRVDASSQVGTGHFMRCLALAEELCKARNDVHFICRDLPSHFNVMLIERRIGLVALSGAPLVPPADDLAHSFWLWTDQMNDAKACLQALGDALWDWIIVDHYALDHRWENLMRKIAKKVMVIDDLADRDHDCDLLLDQNLFADLNSRYEQRVPNSCTCLLGPQYALLQSEYAELHQRSLFRSGSVQQILVFFGGVDQHNLTMIALSAFLRLQRNDIALNIVIGSQNQHATAIRLHAQKHTNITVFDALPSLAPLMLEADLAIGAGGVTSWERCCLGLPALVVTLADNQRSIAKELNQRGVVRWLGHYDTVTEVTLVQALEAVTKGVELEAWSEACKRLVDGQGGERVAGGVTLNVNTILKARLARLDDEDLLLHWANELLVRQNAFNSEIILPEIHRKWFRSRIDDFECCRIYIVETEAGLPIGQVRFELIDDDWEIDFSLCRLARGRNIGKKLLETAILGLNREEIGKALLGRVKGKNKPSCSVFEALGFKKEVESDYFLYRLRFDDYV